MVPQNFADNKHYEMKTSKTGHPVPVVDGVHLHSIYNPVKEAEVLAEKNIAILESRKEILVLGLGMGYHINEFTTKMKQLHGESYVIYVLEPNPQIIHDCKSYGNIIDQDHVLIYSSNTAEELYQNRAVINWLMRRPGIIAHPASFNLNQAYYKNFMSYKADTRLAGWLAKLKDKELAQYLSQFNGEDTLSECIASIKDWSRLSHPADYLMLALGAMTKNSEEIREGGR